MAVQRMPFCRLSAGDGYTMLTRKEYDQQMSRGDRPWCTPDGQEAWYDDKASEMLQALWYIAVRVARLAVGEWEAAHKGTIPQWAKSF